VQLENHKNSNSLLRRALDLATGAAVLASFFYAGYRIGSAGNEQHHWTATGDGSASSAYVGSAGSSTYHLTSCRWAGRIKLGNRVGWDSREAAAEDGRFPCKECGREAMQALHGDDPR
jgi:hypothetical protein